MKSLTMRPGFGGLMVPTPFRRRSAEGSGMGKFSGLAGVGRRLGLIPVWVWLAVAILSPSVQAADRKPNVVIIVGDDLGYADLGSYGGKEIPTPNLDSLAGAGIRFTSGYVSGPYCSPTRAGLLTGRYQQRFGHEFNPAGQATNGAPVGLPLTQTTLANRLKSAGYATGLVGKWHLGDEPAYHPVNRGFDEFFGFLGAAHSYTNLAGGGRNAIHRGLQPVKETEYLTDAFTREALSFIDRHAKEPFFLYLAYNAVHSPLDTHPRYFDRFASIQDPKRRRFATLLAALDDGVGAVRKKLQDTGLERDTLVVFFSDNGGPTADNTSRNDPLRGFKSTTWEGGVRIPFFVSWAGRLPAGKVDDRPVIQLDLHATALAVAGVEIRPEWKLDGVNLLPYLDGTRTDRPHEALFWRFGQQIAVRKGDWKLVKAVSPGPATIPDLQNWTQGKARTEGAELYQLADDIGEKTNLAAREPGRVKELAAAWEAWNAGNVDPLWRQGGGGGGRQVASNASTNGPWKSGDSLSREEAPKVVGRGLEISAEVESAGQQSGVLVAQGAGFHGYAIYLDQGHPAIALRRSSELTVVRSTEPLPSGRSKVEARLASDGRLTLWINGKSVAEGRAGGTLQSQPGEGLSVGDDGNSSVGDYAAPNPFAGRVENVLVKVL